MSVDNGQCLLGNGVKQNGSSALGAGVYHQKKIIRTYNIQTTWDGQPINHDPIKITVGPVESTGHVMLSASGPFFNDSERPPNSTVGEPYYGLWNYEAVEVFFLNDENHLLNTILSPYGVHLLLLSNEKDQLPMNYTATISGPMWHGVAHIPGEYFPPKVSRFNAYGTHGSDQERKYESLYPVPAGKYTDPIYNRLDYFKLIDFKDIVPDNWSQDYTSSEWN
ncbi:UPF0462 protein C4orf33 homolog [Mya arenaria]|uniref:UPF0462 protein C4orf33 homolog n=1 Tax=Mya arenaria TaxID=6604 RepID=UPI0022E0110F|nr:UPF0462 protein C4orf33 homolog [Mya arenaria]